MKTSVTLHVREDSAEGVRATNLTRYHPDGRPTLCVYAGAVDFIGHTDHVLALLRAALSAAEKAMGVEEAAS